MSPQTREQSLTLLFRVLSMLVTLVELGIRVLDLVVVGLELGIRKVSAPRRLAPPEDRELES